MSGNAACFLSRLSQPSAGWPSPQETHSWLTPPLQNSQNSARATTTQPAPQPPAPHARTRPPGRLCPFISFRPHHGPGATGQTQKRRQSRLTTGRGQSQVQRPDSLGFSILCCEGRALPLSTVMIIARVNPWPMANLVVQPLLPHRSFIQFSQPKRDWLSSPFHR